MILNKLHLLYIVIYLFNQCTVHINSLCPNGYFLLPSMKYCRPWLLCDEIDQIRVVNLIGYGSTKNVYLAVWNNHSVTYSVLRNRQFMYDFYFGLSILQFFSPNIYFVQLLGYCRKTNVIITEYHEFNNALNYKYLKSHQNFSLKERFRFCLNYVEILQFMHSSDLGVRVNCDSNDLYKLLTQFLITKNGNLVLNDVDTFPEVKTNSSIKCGKKNVKAALSAPEQSWKQSGPYDYKLMKGYNEKIDIWKVPDVCNYFLEGPDYEVVQYMLFDIHQSCKAFNPNDRPSAKMLKYLYHQFVNYLD